MGWWARRRAAASAPRPIGSTEDLRRERQATSNRQASVYGWALLVLLFLQMALANGIMVMYATDGVGWKIPNTVMHTWLGATVVQVVGLVYVVVSHLFPKPHGDADE